MKPAYPVIGLAALLLALVATGLAARAQRPEPPTDRPAASQDKDEPKDKDKVSLWMKHKLAASQSILEGLTRGDFALIAKQADSLQVMSYLEDTVRSELPGYQAQLHAFSHALGAMERAAEEKNLDGLTLAYTQLTISCVQCHKVIRDGAGG